MLVIQKLYNKYKANIVIDFLMIIHGYEANRGEHKKRSENGRINHGYKSSKFSEEELRRVESKVNELYERNHDIYRTDLVDYFDKEKEKHRISTKRVGRPNYSGESPISKHKLSVIIDYMEKHLKTIKCIEGVGRTRTKFVPITISEQLRKRSSYAYFELVHLGEEVIKLKKKSKLTDEDIL